MRGWCSSAPPTSVRAELVEALLFFFDPVRKRGRPFDKLRACTGLDPGANGKEYGHRQPHWPRISFSLAWVVASISPNVLSVSFCTPVSWRLRSSSPNSPFFSSVLRLSQLGSASCGERVCQYV